MVVLENNRNGRTKCYSTSAAALNGPKKSNQSSPVRGPTTPETTPILLESFAEAQEDQEVKVAIIPTENGYGQQTNGLPLSSSSASTTILEDAVRETLLPPASDVIQDIPGCVSVAPSLPDTLSSMSNSSGCKESAGALSTRTQHFQQRSETSI